MYKLTQNEYVSTVRYNLTSFFLLQSRRQTREKITIIVIKS
jgi:hypothetical protein